MKISFLAPKIRKTGMKACVYEKNVKSVLLAIFLSVYILPVISFAQQQIRLGEPKKNELLKTGDLTFTWELKSTPESAVPEYYQILVWSRKAGVTKTFTINSEYQSDSRPKFELQNFRQQFPSPGEYWWRVTAFFNDNTSITSRASNFTIGVISLSDFTEAPYSYEVGKQFVNRIKTTDYAGFLDNIPHKAHLKSYHDFNFIFSQNQIGGSRFSLQQRLFIHSSIGVGGELGIKYNVLTNRFIGISPIIKSGFALHSTGLHEYSSNTHTINIGAEFRVMPGGFITFYGFWTPLYNIRYSVQEGGLRTFEGEGWDAGIRILLSSGIVKSVHLLGMEMDLSRIPFEFHVGSIKDQYSGVIMNVHRFCVGYIL